jgi:ubiquinone/menaquinone biosynthesis C-methylase UbiE
MNFERIYKYRFQHVDKKKKDIVWKEIAGFIFDKLNRPQKIIDPAAGLCEFINHVPSSEKWAVDMHADFLEQHAAKEVKKVIGNSLDISLPADYFDGVFISNFLEHLNSQEEVASLLEKLYHSLKKGGRIAVIGPNFKYCTSEYFDFADHTVILSELGLAEHLYGAGFEIREIHPQFLPLSFRSNGLLPVTQLTVSAYLKIPVAWKFMGKQFLLVAEK